VTLHGACLSLSLFVEICSSSPLYFNYLSTPNIIVNVHHALLYERAVHAMRRRMKLNSDDSDSGSKKCKRDYGGAYD
jgi:hypothetical protein